MLRGEHPLPAPRPQGPKKTGIASCFLILFFSILSNATAEENWKSLDTDVSLPHFPVKCVDDLPRLIHQDNVPVFLIGAIATAYEWGADDPKDLLRDDLKKLNVQPLFDFGNFYGEGWVEGGTALSSWVLGSVVGDPKLSLFGRDAAESLLLSTVLVTGVKVAVNRKRPDGGDYSFPSGHTITAFCLAPVVVKYWGWGAGAGAYALGVLTGLSRVESNHHYLSDVLAGATLGILVGETVVRGQKDLSLSAGPTGPGLRLVFN